MFERFTNPTVLYARRMQRGLEEARMAALEHESAAEHHAALSKMYRERVTRLQAELQALAGENQAQRTAEEAVAEAARVHRITPRHTAKREEAASSGSNAVPSGYLPQGAAG